MVYNIFFPNYPEYNLTGGPAISAIRSGDWKYVRRTVGYAGWDEPPATSTNDNYPQMDQFPEWIVDFRDGLFNVVSDPEERENLIEIETVIATEMIAKLDEYVADLPDGFYPPQDPAGSPENFGGIWDAGWC